MYVKKQQAGMHAYRHVATEVNHWGKRPVKNGKKQEFSGFMHKVDKLHFSNRPKKESEK